MYAFSIEASVKEGRRLELTGLPFTEGERVEVVLLRIKRGEGVNCYPLQGTPVEYTDPLEPVADEDWLTLS